MDRVFFNLLLILLPTQLGYHSWPEWSMVLGRRMDYLSPTLYLTDILVVLILIFHRPKKVPLILLPVLIFATANIFFATSPMPALFMWMKIIEYIWLGAYIVETKPDVPATIYFLSVGVLYSSVIAIAQYVLQHSVGLWVFGERTFSVDTPGIARFAYGSLYKLRAYGTFPHPNVLGGFLAVMLPLMVHEFSKKKMWYALTLFFGFIALVVTFSRSAWMAALFALGSMYFWPLLFLALPFIFLVARTVGSQDESVVVREGLSRAAIFMTAHAPLIGVGLGNFLINLPDALVSRQIFFLQPVHNIYLLVLAETGIVGFIALAWVIFVALKKKSIVHIPLTTFLFLGLVDHYPITLQQGQLLLTILLSLALIV